MEKILFIVNPVSGSGNGLKFYNKYLANPSTDYNFNIIFTEYRNHAMEICSQNSCHYDIIVVCGGDGTFNEVINGINLECDVKIGLIPVGSGNDFIRNINQSSDPLRYFTNLLDKKYDTNMYDIGHITLYDSDSNSHINRSFINSCGIGFDAYVAYLNQSKKKIKGKLSYIYSIIVGLYKSKSIEYSGIFDKINKSGKNLLISVGNGKTAGGGLYLTPKAEINDNLLDFTFLNDISKLKLIFYLLPKALMNKIENSTHISLEKYRNASIELKNPYFVHVDGESVSNSASKIELKINEKKLKFITA